MADTILSVDLADFANKQAQKKISELSAINQELMERLESQKSTIESLNIQVSEKDELELMVEDIRELIISLAPDIKALAKTYKELSSIEKTFSSYYDLVEQSVEGIGSVKECIDNIHYKYDLVKNCSVPKIKKKSASKKRKKKGTKSVKGKRR